MAEIYLGESVGAAGSEESVAIKSIIPDLTSDPRFTEMLIQEAKIATLLDHANIVRVLDLGQIRERYYIVMEYVDGADLDNTLRHARGQGIELPVSLACLICRRVLDGLCFVHERTDEHGQPLHLVHRDVSPPNILLSRAGEVKLADFGIAKVKDRPVFTETGMIRGKLAYMSPEQACKAELDGRSDLFNLGIVLHELLSGKPLFKAADQFAMMQEVREARIDPPSRDRPGIPAVLDEVVLRALARDREARFPSARDFGLALDSAIKRARLRARTADLSGWLERALPPRHVEALPPAGEVLALKSAPLAEVRGVGATLPSDAPGTAGAEARARVPSRRRLAVLGLGAAVLVVTAGAILFWARSC